jgi:hypothetical protein
MKWRRVIYYSWNQSRFAALLVRDTWLSPRDTFYMYLVSHFRFRTHPSGAFNTALEGASHPTWIASGSTESRNYYLLVFIIIYKYFKVIFIHFLCSSFSCILFLFLYFHLLLLPLPSFSLNPICWLRYLYLFISINKYLSLL